MKSISIRKIIFSAIMLIGLSLSGNAHAGFTDVMCSIHGTLSGAQTENSTKNGCQTVTQECTSMGGTLYSKGSTTACLTAGAYASQVAQDNCSFPNTFYQGSCMTPTQYNSAMSCTANSQTYSNGGSYSVGPVASFPWGAESCGRPYYLWTTTTYTCTNGSWSNSVTTTQTMSRCN